MTETKETYNDKMDIEEDSPKTNEQLLKDQHTEMLKELLEASAVWNETNKDSWKRFGNCHIEALAVWNTIYRNLNNKIYTTNNIYYYNYDDDEKKPLGNLEGCIKATKNYWKIRLLLAHGGVNPEYTIIDQGIGKESTVSILQDVNYRPPYQTYMINQSACGSNSRLNIKMWIDIRNRLRELGYYLNNRHEFSLSGCDEVLSEKSLLRVRANRRLMSENDYKNVIKRSLRNLVGDANPETTVYSTRYADPWNLEINNPNTHITNSLVSLNSPLPHWLIPVESVDKHGKESPLKDNNKVPIINGVLCTTPLEMTDENQNNVIRPTFTILPKSKILESIPLHTLLDLDQYVHSIYPRGYPTTRNNDRYIVANIVCRGLGNVPSEYFVPVTNLLRQSSLTYHGSESPRTVGDVDKELWRGGKRKKRKRKTKRKKRKKKKTKKKRKRKRKRKYKTKRR